MFLQTVGGLAGLPSGVVHLPDDRERAHTHPSPFEARGESDCLQREGAELSSLTAAIGDLVFEINKTREYRRCTEEHLAQQLSVAMGVSTIAQFIQENPSYQGWEVRSLVIGPMSVTPTSAGSVADGLCSHTPIVSQRGTWQHGRRIYTGGREIIISLLNPQSGASSVQHMSVISVAASLQEAIEMTSAPQGALSRMFSGPRLNGVSRSDLERLIFQGRGFEVRLNDRIEIDNPSPIHVSVTRRTQ